MADKSGNTDFPIAFPKFAAALKGTADEVWTHWLRLNHGREKHTVKDWMTVLASHRDRPAKR